MSRSRTDARRRPISGIGRISPSLAPGLVSCIAGLGLMLVLAVALGGCSSADLYLDRREHMHLSTGDAIAANKVTMMVDPWPPASAKKDILFNGDKMQVAAERYRTGKVIPPTSPTTSAAAPALTLSQGAALNGKP